MIHCRNCGGEVEEGLGFCPHCGKSVGSDVDAQAQAAVVSSPPNVVPVPTFGVKRDEGDKSRRVIYVSVAVVSLLLIAGLAYLASRPAVRPGEEHLEDAVRPGSPDYPAGDKLIVEFDPNDNADIAPTALGPWAVAMRPIVRNFTGRTVNGLEFHVVGVDPKGQPIRERIFISRDEIEPNKTFTPSIGINFPQDNKPADLKLELTGVRFK
ncbi:MAG: hypothetical protein QOH51_453 [Acidobacteriota bacterium]|jgi:hypothetical protein|nr:hypothetical protein [Acidobacteriota bacterium]